MVKRSKLCSFTIQIKDNQQVMKAIIKFVDTDLVNGTTDLMVGIERVTISSKHYRALREAISKAGRIVKPHPFVGYVNVTPEMTYERRFASEVKTILKIAAL